MEENRRRGRSSPEYELLDTGVFDEDRYFDVLIEYAKAGVNDILIRVSVTNRGPEAAALDLLPTLWFRNTWAWDRGAPRPTLSARERAGRRSRLDHDTLGMRWLVAEGSPELLFTDNDTNFERLWGAPNESALREGRDRRLRRARGRGTRQPRAHGHQGRAPLSRDARPRRVARRRAAARRRAGRSGISSAATSTRSSPAACREADEFYATVVPGLPARRRQARDAPGARRAPLDQAVLPLRRPALARGRPRAAAAAPPSAGAAATASGRTSTTPTSSRCRTSGSTRGTRPGTSPSTAARSPSSTRTSPSSSSSCSCASGTCTRTASSRPTSGPSATSTRPVHAWAAWRVYKIEQKRLRGNGGPRLPRARVPQAAAELHVVGEPQGRRGATTSSRAASSASTTSASSTAVGAAAHRRPHRAVRRHELDGDVLPQHARDRARAGARGSAPTRTSRASSSSTSSTSRTP